MMEQIKVLLADDKEVFREGLARLLEEREHIEVVSRCSNGKQAIEKVKKQSPMWC
jgi:YesN/AraC family two-component response regulator